MAAGPLDQRAAFSRRPFVDDDPNRRGDAYSEQYLTAWARYARLSGAQKLQAGALIDDEIATLTIRDSRAARQITASDRVSVQGRDYAVQTVSPADRSTGTIAIVISSDLGD